jgi:ACS family glucarate transporter-like MFS transporter
VILFLESSVVNKLAQKTTQTAAFFAPELGLSAPQVGELNAAWMIGMIPMMPLSGYLAAKFGPRRMLIVASVVMCTISPAMAFVHAFGQIYVLNIAAGACMGIVMPAGVVMIARWFTASEVAGAVGLFSIAGALAGVVLNPLYLWVTDMFGWRNQSLVTTVLIVVVFMMVLHLKDHPSDSVSISADELAHIAKGQPHETRTEGAGSAKALLNVGCIVLMIALGLSSAAVVQFNWLWFAVLTTLNVNASTLGLVTSAGFMVAGVYALKHGRAVVTVFGGQLNRIISLGALVGVAGFLIVGTLLTGNWVLWSLMLTVIVMLLTPLCAGTSAAYFAVLYGPAAAGVANGVTAAVGLTLGFLITNEAGNWVNPNAQGLQQYVTIWIVAAALCVPLVLVPWLIRKVVVT